MFGMNLRESKINLVKMI